MSIVAFATALVIASLWLLEQLDVMPAGWLHRWLARPALLILVVAMFAVPAAYRDGLDWFVERKTNEMLDRIQPALDEITRSNQEPAPPRLIGNPTR